MKPMQHKEYAHDERKHSEEDMKRNSEAYWLDKLSGDLSVLQLPTDFYRPAHQGFDEGSAELTINEEKTNSLKQLARNLSVVPYMFLIAIFNVLLYKLSRQEDILIGTSVTMKNAGDSGQTTGELTDMAVLRSKPKGNKKLEDFLIEVKDSLLEIYRHRYPFEDLSRKLDMQNTDNRNPLVNTMFTYESNLYPCVDKEGNYDSGVAISRGESGNPTVDLFFKCFEKKETIDLSISYNTGLFAEGTIMKWGSYFMNILEELLADSKKSLSEIEMLSEKDRNRILVEFNDTFKDAPLEKTIHRLFEDQAEKVPENTAIMAEEVMIPGARKASIFSIQLNPLSVGELNRRANQLAHYIKNKRGGGNRYIGICLEPSVEMVVAVLAVWKTGCAYVPLDSSYPINRLQFMLDDSGIDLIVTQKSLEQKLSGYCNELIFIDKELKAIEKESSTNLEHDGNPEDNAYLIYTSGSTGQPKGVMIPHKGVINMSYNYMRKFSVTPSDNILQFANFSFDGAVFEFGVALLSGATLVIAPRRVLSNFDAFEQFLNRENITMAVLPPTFLSYLNPDKINTLKSLMTAGSEANPEVVKIWAKKLTCYNGYGPTENSVATCTYKVNDMKTFPSSRVPIGKPNDNVKVYILDEFNNVMPIGVSGELCISGDSLSLGYWNRPDLTREKFVLNPFMPASIMYRSGDLARWMPDGTIEFLGRIDNQVKIRGFRIEISEIDRAILSHPEIKEEITIVISDKDNNRYLASYFVAKPGSSITEKDLRNKLAGELPNYMLPDYVIKLSGFPLNLNGKIDTKALPKPKINATETPASEDSTCDKIEYQLQQFWQSVLSKENVGLDDNFFDLGGQSLNIVEINSYIHKEYQVELPMECFFEKPTINAIAENIKRIQNGN